MKRRSKTERLFHLEAWESSGLSKQAYCELHDLKYGTFMSWFSLLDGPKSSGGDFIELSVGMKNASPGCDWHIALPNGIKLSYSGKMNAELLKLLQDA